jgi:ubiquinone/menaquinone biosynthesis C-methylase UbiE
VDYIMQENTDNVLKDSVGKGGSTLEAARDYEKTRFLRRREMHRIDRFEKQFARDLLVLVGTDGAVLDAPCGNGRFFDIFSAAKELIMVDYSANMLQALEEKHGASENVRLIRADITEMPLDDESVDLCFCMRLFHHMKTDEVRLNALRELSRITRKYVGLSFYNKNCLSYYYRRVLGKKIRGNYVTSSHLRELAGQAGLECIERRPSVNLFEKQCLLIFKKTEDGGG